MRCSTSRCTKAAASAAARRFNSRRIRARPAVVYDERDETRSEPPTPHESRHAVSSRDSSTIQMNPTASERRLLAERSHLTCALFSRTVTADLEIEESLSAAETAREGN